MQHTGTWLRSGHIDPATSVRHFLARAKCATATARHCPEGSARRDGYVAEAALYLRAADALRTYEAQRRTAA